jgi:UDP-N-acetylmuramate dehydrogenase
MHTVMNRSLRSHLEGVEGVLLHDEPMDRHTSWRVGGKAEMFYVPTDKASLVQLMCQLPGNVPVFWFGLGSNLLVRDAGIPGMVVCTFKGMDEIERVDKESVYAQAGVACAKLAKFCARRGLVGAEFLAGIPGSFGGAVAMNAGAFGGDTWSMIERIECLDREGNIAWFEKSEISYQYRYVDLPENNWIIGAQIKLKSIKGLDLGRRIRELLKTRGNSQPVQSANAGSVFKNPENDHAARLLEEVGMKGRAIGGAEYSTKHANFIINKGNANASDIEALIELGRKAVKQRFGIELEPEVRIVGQSKPIEPEVHDA